MQAEGFLTLVANLSVVLAGFTGLVGVFGAELRNDGGAIIRGTTRLLVEYGIVTLVMAVLPLALWNAGVPESLAWRIASAVVVVQVAAYYWLRFAQLRDTVPAVSRSAFWIVCSVDWLLAILLVFAALGVFASGPVPFYVAYLGWSLLGALSSFARLVRPVWEPFPGSDSE